MLSNLIAEKFKDSDSYSDCNLTPEQVEEFQDKGLISEDAIRRIASQWSETHYLDLQFLLNLLGHLHIVVKLQGDDFDPETKYFMPCVLAGNIHDLSTPEDVSEPIVADLLILFDHGRQYCPKGLFSVFVIKLAQKPKQDKAKYTWVLNRKELRNREGVVFHVKVMDSECEYSYAVHIQHGIVGSRSMLRIFIMKPCSPSREQVCCLKKNLESACKEIRDSVTSALKSSLDELHKSTKLYIGFYSTCGKNQTSNERHIAIVKDLFQEHSGVPQHMTCIHVDCRNEICLLEEEHKVWFKEVSHELDPGSQGMQPQPVYNPPQSQPMCPQQEMPWLPGRAPLMVQPMQPRQQHIQAGYAPPQSKYPELTSQFPAPHIGYPPQPDQYASWQGYSPVTSYQPYQPIASQYPLPPGGISRHMYTGDPPSQYTGLPPYADPPPSQYAAPQAQAPGPSYQECLRGFTAFSERSFFIGRRDSQIFKWDGIKLHIQEGAVPAECKVDVKIGLVGQFQFPDDYELVSCIYWLSCPQKFLKPVRLQIQHCASIEDPSHVCFVVAKSSQQDLPYKFKVLENGIFSRHSSYGTIEISQFSFFAIIIRKIFRRHISYYSALYYIQQDVNSWHADIVLTRNLEAHLQVSCMHVID